MGDGLFDMPQVAAGEPAAGPETDGSVWAPLAVRMRPRTLDEVVGQDHLLGPGAPLRRLVEGAGTASVILYGPPGNGKTTLAQLISRQTGRHFAELSALSAGVAEVRAVLTAARRRRTSGRQTVLFIDEIHRFSKNQQDALLAAVEEAVVLLLGATTENPSFSVVAPLLSRSLVLSVRALEPAQVRTLLVRAVADERGLAGRLTVTEAALEHVVRVAGGDARRALTVLEAAAEAAAGEVVDVEDVAGSMAVAVVRYDRAGQQHYDVISAFIKSIRGSDVDAAVHYLARMLSAGEDPRFIARRLLIQASEDIGMADPTALPVATAAAQTVALVGMPEARLALAQATIHLATAPKSGAVIAAIDAATRDVASGRIGAVPAHLQDSHGTVAGGGMGYRYPHEDPDGVVSQQYPPDELIGIDYYQPTTHGHERLVSERIGKLRAIVRDV